MSPRRKSQSRSPSAMDILPDAELEVLSCLWRKGEATAKDVRAMMAGYRPMTQGAMVTLMKRLQARGAVTRKKAEHGKAFVYIPAHGPGPTHRGILRRLVDRVFHGNGVAMVSRLLETRVPSHEDLQRLQALLDDLRAKEKKSSGE